MPPSAAHTSMGRPIALALPSSDAGQLVMIPATPAKVTVLDFFSPTCIPCREKVPALWARKAEIEALGGSLVLVGVLADSESTADARKALASWGVPNAPFLVDSGDASSREAGVRDLPATLVLDTAGNLRWVAPASAHPEDVVTAVRTLAKP